MTAVLFAGVACAGLSQEPLEVGAVAPGFSLTGATRDGVLSSPVRLEDLRDKTVVIAFFYQAKTKG
jgi:peroxiredoxin